MAKATAKYSEMSKIYIEERFKCDMTIVLLLFMTQGNLTKSGFERLNINNDTKTLIKMFSSAYEIKYHTYEKPSFSPTSITLTRIAICFPIITATLLAERRCSPKFIAEVMEISHNVLFVVLFLECPTLVKFTTLVQKV